MAAPAPVPEDRPVADAPTAAPAKPTGTATAAPRTTSADTGLSIPGAS